MKPEAVGDLRFSVGPLNEAIRPLTLLGRCNQSCHTNVESHWRGSMAQQNSDTQLCQPIAGGRDHLSQLWNKNGLPLNRLAPLSRLGDHLSAEGISRGIRLPTCRWLSRTALLLPPAGIVKTSPYG